MDAPNPFITADPVPADGDTTPLTTFVSTPAIASDDRTRRITLLVFAVLLWTLGAIVVQIVSAGHVPTDDALRHVAKAISGRSWQEVLVLRPDMRLDPHPGWHALLAAVHHAGLSQAKHLLTFSVGALAPLVLVMPLPSFRRPEA